MIIDDIRCYESINTNNNIANSVSYAASKVDLLLSLSVAIVVSLLLLLLLSSLLPIASIAEIMFSLAIACYLVCHYD